MYQKTRFNNIYKAGSTYRVRVTKNGKRHSKYCKTCREALYFRDAILNS